jgi:polysaccharide deacetylase family protein (PEP-CTERM system associated)
MRYVYLTVDIEEWYELDYLKEYNLKNTIVEVVPQIIDFLNMLDELNIKATFFIVAEIAEKNADTIREIKRRGHAIGCHGYDHCLLYEKTNEQFLAEITKAKKLIEIVAKCEVDGYRAACFSMSREKLELTRKAGFLYDSSKIRFDQHPLYRNLDLTGFEQLDDLVHRNGNFVEYEIPTLKLWKYNIPISGGGYLRLFPFFIMKRLIKMYEKSHKNFLLYVHPFELTNIKLPLPDNIGFKTKFRCLVGRKHNLRKIRKVITFLKNQGAEFRTLTYDRKNRLGID